MKPEPVGTKPKYKVNDVVLFHHGWRKNGSKIWVGAKVEEVYDRSRWHLADKEGRHFKYRIQIPPELVFGEWLEICEPNLRPGTKKDLRYKGVDNRKDPGIQRMLGDVRAIHGLGGD